MRDELRELHDAARKHGLRESELRDAAKCEGCGRKIGETGFPAFYRLRIERHGFDLKAIERQQGLAMQLGGSAALAHAMGPDEPMTVPLMEPRTVTVCEECSSKPLMLLALREEGEG